MVPFFIARHSPCRRQSAEETRRPVAFYFPKVLQLFLSYQLVIPSSVTEAGGAGRSFIDLDKRATEGLVSAQSGGAELLDRLSPGQ
jgi:hypothetical protein